MASSTGPDIVTDGLLSYFDISNPRCVDATQSITSNTRLNNLAESDIQLQPYDVSNGNMSFVIDEGQYVYNQNGINGGNPCWVSTANVERYDVYTLICWFKYNRTSQRSDQIFSTGFSDTNSVGSAFYLTSGYADRNGIIQRFWRYGQYFNTYIINNNYGAGDNNWHQFASVSSFGTSSTPYTKFYLDGIYKSEVILTGSTVGVYRPTDPSEMIWGAWKPNDRNFNGKTNCFMYYNRALTAEEISQNFNATRGRFGI